MRHFLCVLLISVCLHTTHTHTKKIIQHSCTNLKITIFFLFPFVYRSKSFLYIQIHTCVNRNVWCHLCTLISCCLTLCCFCAVDAVEKACFATTAVIVTKRFLNVELSLKTMSASTKAPRQINRRMYVYLVVFFSFFIRSIG